MSYDTDPCGEPLDRHPESGERHEDDENTGTVHSDQVVSQLSSQSERGSQTGELPSACIVTLTGLCSIDRELGGVLVRQRQLFPLVRHPLLRVSLCASVGRVFECNKK